MQLTIRLNIILAADLRMKHLKKIVRIRS